MYPGRYTEKGYEEVGTGRLEGGNWRDSFFDSMNDSINDCEGWEDQ